MIEGSSHSEATRAKISKSMKGKRKSPETREKMSIKRSIYWAKERQKYRQRMAQQEQELLNNVREPRSSFEQYSNEAPASPSPNSEVFGRGLRTD